MPIKKPYKVRTLYFPDHLEEKLNSIHDYPLTIIEAPSGFGKTTSLKYFFERLKFDDINVQLITFHESSSTVLWGMFCDAICKIDIDCGNILKQIKSPKADDLYKISSALDSISCNKKTYLIVDNAGEYDLFNLKTFTDALSAHGLKELHIILAKTQAAGKKIECQIPNRLINYIDSKSFIFTLNDIIAYYKKIGIKITQEQANFIYDTTEGWVLVVYLQMLSFLETKSLKQTDIDTLINQIFWDKLNKDEQHFFVNISILPFFTLEQAILVGELSEPTAKNLIVGNSFIKSDNNDAYHLHDIFLKYLRKKFDLLQIDEKKRIWLSVANCAKLKNDIQQALIFYKKACEIEEIFSMLDSSDSLLDSMDTNTKELILELFDNTSLEIKLRHPKAVLSIAFTIFFIGRTDEIIKNQTHISEIIEKSNVEQKQKNNLMGEFELIFSFLEYNRIEDMSRRHKKALSLLESSSHFIRSSDTWTFGSLSVLCMFWREISKLDEELNQMDECMPIYYSITDGHGSGAELVMRAEAQFLRGDIGQAEILCHKALLVAEKKKQASIYQCCLFLLSRIAVCRSDEKILNSLFEKMLKSFSDDEFNRYTIDLYKCLIAIASKNLEIIPEWFLKGDFENRYSIMAMPFVYTIYGKILLLQKEYYKLIGSCEYFLEIASIFPNLLSQVYLLIYMAASNYSIGQIDKSITLLNKALNIASPDKIYVPFLENFTYIESILNASTGTDRQRLNEIKILSKTFFITNTSTASKLLTARELDVATLAKQRLSSKEIAQKLCLSDGTVRNLLTKIYEKLNISSKSELNKIKL